MRIAISVDDELLSLADREARRIGVSRSRLFSIALQEHLGSLRQRKIIEDLDRVYAGEPNAADRLLAARTKLTFRSTIRDRW